MVDVPIFHGSDNEDPTEWIELFIQAHTANGWPNQDARKIALAGGHMREAARDWFQRLPNAVNAFRNNGNNAVSFYHTFINYFSTDAKKRQWTRELQSIKQLNGESVEAYTNRFRKLLTRATQGACSS